MLARLHDHVSRSKGRWVMVIAASISVVGRMLDGWVGSREESSDCVSGGVKWWMRLVQVVVAVVRKRVAVRMRRVVVVVDWIRFGC